MNAGNVLLRWASSGEMRTGGVGMAIGWGIALSPFGACSLAWVNAGVVHLGFPISEDEVVPTVKEDWPNAAFDRDDGRARDLAHNVFFASRHGGLPVFVGGTDFHRAVWEVLLRIPAGETSTYSRIAAAIGRPGAARAVGGACGANPVAWLIPCHRVARATGGVGGYRWGTGRKAEILAAESAQIKLSGPENCGTCDPLARQT